METWIVSDPDTLRKHYGKCLQDSALPPCVDLESRDRHKIQEALDHATRNCKGPYEKGKRSFSLLGKLNPEALQKHLPSFARIVRILNEKL
jgi:hypothetical protein